MTFLNTLWQEIHWLLRHKGALMIIVAAPLIYSVFYPLPYQLAVVEEIPILVWDNANSEETRQWIAQLDASPKLKVIAHLPGEPNEQQWQAFPEAQAFVHFPANTKARLAQQQQVVLAYGGKADNFLTYSTAARAIGMVIADINEQWSLQYLYLSDGNAVTAQQNAHVVDSEIVPLFNHNASYLQYLVPGVFILMVQQVVMMALGMQWAYRFEMNRPASNALALWHSQLLIYTLHGIALILYFFKWALPHQEVVVDISSLQLILTALPFVLGSIGFGMVLTFAMREQETPLILMLPLSVPMLFLTGISWPSFAMNDWLVTAAQWLPSTWGVHALVEATFMKQPPNMLFGWAVALFWLSFSLFLRLTVPGDTPVVKDPSTA